MARVMESIFGLEKPKKILVESMLKNQLAHVYLFSGPEGIGKKKLALAIAQALLCPVDSLGCGNCPSCHRVEIGTHEGLLIVEPEFGHQIKIERSREILEFLSLKSITKNRVIIIDQAHLLNPQAANSLLKIIEEPPVGTFFFLITHNASLLLSTVRSRSRIIRFQALTNEELSQAANSLKEQEVPGWAITAARGSFKKIHQLTDPDEQSERVLSSQILQSFLFSENFLLEQEWRNTVKERSGYVKMIYYWLSFIRDAIFLKSGEGQLVLNQDLIQMLNKIQQFDKQWLLALMGDLIELETHQAINRDPQLVFEELWIRSQRGRLLTANMSTEDNQHA